jgi:hypothetical protein
MPRNSRSVAKATKTKEIAGEKKVGRRPRGALDKRVEKSRQGYRLKVDPELLDEAARYRSFRESAHAHFKKIRGTFTPQHNDFVYYQQNEKNVLFGKQIRLPLPNEKPSPTIDTLTLTREVAFDADEPSFLFKLIQGLYTRLPKEFVELQPNGPLWIFCFEKNGLILSELVHKSLHDHRAKIELKKLLLAYELHCQGKSIRKKFRIEPHVELLAFGLNRGLDRDNVTAEDRAEYLDDFCPDCTVRDPLAETAHPVTSTHRLWRYVRNLKRRFTEEPQKPKAETVEGLTAMAWRGLQQIRMSMFRDPTSLLDSIISRLELSESLSAEQRALRNELRQMTPQDREALTEALARRTSAIPMPVC